MTEVRQEYGMVNNDPIVSLQSALGAAIAKIGDLWSLLPPLIRLLLDLVIIVAIVNIVLSLVKAIIANKDNWKPKAGTELMYSFSGGSGQYQRNHIYVDAHKLLFDKKWSLISFAGLAYRLGNFEIDSKTITFLATLAYIPLAILGFAEMVFRSVLGVVFYFVINLIYLVLLAIAWVVNAVLMLIFGIIDRTTYATQHCPSCYATYKLPTFKCPSCGKMHSKLSPSICGLLWARCSCGHFIPCSSLSKRNDLPAFCPNPNCGKELASANIQSLTIQVVGGNSSGKTAFISAFQHLYRNAKGISGAGTIEVSPSADFDILEEHYGQGKTEPSSTDTVHAYYILHEGESHTDTGIIFYDVPDEVILNEQYERNPLNFGYNDGVVIIIDPLSIRTVRNECEASLGSAYTQGFSEDSAEDIIVHFINKYSEVAGRRARKMSDMPVAVVISKADLPAIRQAVGADVVKARYEANRAQYETIDKARDAVCRSYLVDIGLANSLNNLESVFSAVSYFPISAIGHAEVEGKAYKPWGVIEPIKWIAQASQNGMSENIRIVAEETA